MCGICGIAAADPTRHLPPERVLRMREALSHRGPDGAGTWCQGPVGLGHRRLSVIDLEGGRQPLSNEEGTVWVTYNGEIYNHAALRNELRDRGHRFRTRSDTEVLVHAYEEFGPSFVRRLNGMFAFALYDVARRRLLLARDQLGVKPLFYSITPEALFFASEIKGVLAGTGREAAASTAALQEYLIFRYVAGERTFFEDVHRLPPGHLATWENGALSLSRYWSPPSPATDRACTLEEASEELDEHLSNAVESQLMSDVPLGTFCSGGIDSGLVTAYAARARGARLDTFCVGFEDRAWDETALARTTAERFGTDHHVVPIRPGDFVQVLQELLRYHDEPLSHPNSVPLYLLSRHAREHVTVVLTGEGADETFGGYPRYHIARLLGAVEKVPAPARASMARILSRLPGHRARKVAELLPLSLEDGLLLNSAYVAPDLVARLTGHPVAEALAGRRRILSEATRAGDAVGSLMRYELLTYLGCALDRMDRMSMATGLEGRVPFLDVPLVEWAMRLPSSLKIAGKTNKRVVRAVAERHLDPAVVHGRKSGFGLPLATWFRQSSFSPLLRRLQDAAHPAARHFDTRVVTSLIAAHLRGSADHSEAIWLLVNVFLWYDVHGVPEAAGKGSEFEAGARPALRA